MLPCQSFRGRDNGPVSGQSWSTPSVAAILFRTLTQVNAKGLLQQVHAAEEGVEAGFGGWVDY